MRLFIAIDCNELKDYFKELQNKIDNSFAKLKPVSAFHLTLKFLGEVPDNVEAIKEKLETIQLETSDVLTDKMIGAIVEAMSRGDRVVIE